MYGNFNVVIYTYVNILYIIPMEFDIASSAATESKSADSMAKASQRIIKMYVILEEDRARKYSWWTLNFIFPPPSIT